MTRSPLYPRLARAARVVLGLAFVWELVAFDPVGALTIAVFVALSFIHLLRDEGLPNVFDVLVALSALLNALGFVFDLYRAVPLYDEVAHAVTVFSLSLASFYLFYRDESRPAGRWQRPRRSSRWASPRGRCGRSRSGRPATSSPPTWCSASGTP